jgi:hypothetical protein
VSSQHRKPLRTRRVARIALLALAGAAAAAGLATLGSGAVAQFPDPDVTGDTSVGLVVNPNPISIGDKVKLTGSVWEGVLDDPAHELIFRANVTVSRYSGPACTLVKTNLVSLQTDDAGNYSFTDTPSTPPPLSYRVDYTGGGSDNDGDFGSAPYEPSSSSCVTVGATQVLSGATAGGRVNVDNDAFSRGVISYGAKISLAPGATLNLGSSVGHVIVYPTGGPTDFIATRTTIPAPTRGNKHRRRPIVVLRLLGGDFSSCSSSALRALAGTKPKPKRSLWARGKGHYRTIGNVSSATVSGTYWLTQDTCAGTLTKVLVGVVAVRDFTTNKTIFVKAGHSYLAKPPPD